MPKCTKITLIKEKYIDKKGMWDTGEWWYARTWWLLLNYAMQNTWMDAIGLSRTENLGFMANQIPSYSIHFYCVKSLDLDLQPNSDVQCTWLGPWGNTTQKKMRSVGLRLDYMPREIHTWLENSYTVGNRECRTLVLYILKWTRVLIPTHVMAVHISFYTQFLPI